MAMTNNYFKIALRNILKYKVFSFINIIGLTIGLSSSFLIGLLIYHEYSFDKFHKDGDRLFRVVTNFESPDGKFYNHGVTLALEDAIKENSNFELVNGFFEESPSSVENKSNGIRLNYPSFVIYATPEYFNMFEYKFLAGDQTSALSAPNQVVLTKSRAGEYFPDQDPASIIGKTLIYNGNISVKVTAVVEDIKELSDFVFNEFLSRATILGTSRKDEFINKEWNSTTSQSQLFVKVSRALNFDAIRQEFNTLAKENADEESKKYGESREFVLQPLNDIHFNADYGVYDWDRGMASKGLLRNLAIVAMFLLLLGCVNFINLTTAQATYRAKEIGIRKTLGGTQKQLITQFMGETFLLVLTSALLSLALSKWSIRLFSDFLPRELKFSLFGTPSIIIGILVLLLIITVLAGFYPALVLSKFNTVSVLKNNMGVGQSKVKLRKTLTIFQFTIAQVFIIATLLVGQQIVFLLEKDMGFKTDAVVTTSTPWGEQDIEKIELYAQKLRAVPGISEISVGGRPPASRSTTSNLASYGNGQKELTSELQLIFGDTNYANVFAINLLAGRMYRNDTLREFVINETARKAYGFKTPQDAIGKRLNFWGEDKVEIVGVMNDFHQRSLKSEIKPMALQGDWYRPEYSQFNSVHMTLNTATPEALKATLDKVEAAFKSVYTEVDEYEAVFMDETIARFYEREQGISKLLNWATGLSILISCLGLLGLVIYTTNRRAKEIGVRKVLGASALQINTLLCTEYLWLVLIAFIIAAPLAWYGVYHWLQDFAYKTSISIWVFMASMVLMTGITLLVMSIKTWQASSSNPVNALRSE